MDPVNDDKDFQGSVSEQRETLAPSHASSHESIETVVYKRADSLDLYADIYLPKNVNSKKRPIALLIHGGGHCLYTRKDVIRQQVELMLSEGYLPISIDYRLCPEMTLAEGPMTDVRDALRWTREELPSLSLDRPGLKIDGNFVAAVGWSTGGTLAMSLGFTAEAHGIKPPDAILTFYSPTNYDDECFKSPIYPSIPGATPLTDSYDLLDGVRDSPIAGYTPLPTGADPRMLLILHMNHRAQTLPILIHGLPSRLQTQPSSPSPSPSFTNMPLPSAHEIASINPHAQILLGNYRTPTYIAHGTCDDLVPYQQSVATIGALEREGVECGIGLAQGAGHLFDMFASEDPAGTGEAVVREGYEFLTGVYRRYTYHDV